MHSRVPAHVAWQLPLQHCAASGHYSVERDSDPATAADLAHATERMKRLARAVLGNEHDAEGATQDAWCRALKLGRDPFT